MTLRDLLTLYGTVRVIDFFFFRIQGMEMLSHICDKAAFSREHGSGSMRASIK